MESIKLIAFDLFGVLITEGHLVSNVLMPLLSDSCDKAEVKLQYEDFNLGKIDEQQFWHSLGQQDNHRLRQKFLDSFTPDADFFEVVSAFKPHYRLAILSNLPAAWADELLLKFQLKKDFNPCLFSGYLRTKKPQPEIYHQLVLATGLEAESIAFIDDRLENLETASALGMTTIHFHREAESSQFQADFRITKLTDLISLFGSKASV